MRLGSLAAAAVVLAALAGCTPPGIGEPVELPEVLEESAGTGDDPAVWEPPDTLTVVLGGSSSCPVTATGLEEADGEVRITLHRAANPVCTLDLVLSPVAFELVEGRPDRVVLLLDGAEYELAVVDGG